ncbi:MAG: amino acid adenylation domain-containing protein, partial [Deltaproteobacteria bacterium]|nr:amino acid adenylation domain-containing protein [Deltaproteobacteria bacterium]
AYVPLDPEYPTKRVAMMVEDSAVPVIVTRASLLKELPENDACVVCMDRDWAAISRGDEKNLTLLVRPDDLAYVIYTSGSTGRPKGVEITHEALSNFLASMAREPGIEGRDELLLVTPISFDISILEMLLPLTVGARVVVLPREVAVDGRLLRERLDGSNATIMQATPMTWRMLLEAGWQGKSGLRILCGGEALSRDLAKTLLTKGASVFNLYGPTETTVWSMVWKVTAGGPVVIGHPIAKTQIYILDTNLQFVPFGVEGDLYIGGIGVARGYRGNPTLTHEKFIGDPFNRKPLARLFKTGDRARFLSDGSIEHLGRSDFQVKVRGNRVEIGEIESVLAEHPSVRQCIVVTKEDSTGEIHLVACVVPAQNKTITQNELQGYLKERLPNYMVPAGIIALNSLPLTPNGKINRDGIPFPNLQLNGADSRVLPRNSMELQLVKIWQELLEVQTVGIRDNFFDLGGHSLLAIRLIAQIENLTGKNIPAATLFRAPTTELLSAYLQEEDQSKAWLNLIPIQTSGSNLPLFLIHGESINLFLSGHLGKDRPLFSLEHQSQDGNKAFYTKVETIAAHYLKEIRSVQPEGPYLLAGYSFGGVVAFEIAQQLQREKQEVALLALRDTMGVNGQQNSIASMLWNASGAKKFSGVFGACLRRRERRATHGANEISFHSLAGLRNFSTYVLKRCSKKIRRAMKTVLCFGYVKMGYSIPPTLRSTYIFNVYLKAARKYVPLPYPGRVIYFKSALNLSDSLLSWRDLVNGGLQVYDIPGDHSYIKKGPYVDAWASILKKELDEAQRHLFRPSHHNLSRFLTHGQKLHRVVAFPTTEKNFGPT